MTRDDLLTLSQRLREYNHNPHHINPVSDAFHKLITESAEALSQFAAIQGGMGEDVAVLATVSMGGVEYGIGGAELGDIDIQPDMKALCALQQSLVTGEDDAHVELIDKAQHQRITAAMAAEVERLREERDSFQRVGILATEERDALRAELAITRRVIDRIGQLCTTPHESKERFIRRVQSVIEWERAAQQDQPK